MSSICARKHLGVPDDGVLNYMRNALTSKRSCPVSIHMWRPGPEKYEPLGQFKPKADRKGDFAHIVDVNYVTSPAIANGKLYVHMSDCVYCYDLTEAGNKPTAASDSDKP